MRDPAQRVNGPLWQLAYGQQGEADASPPRQHERSGLSPGLRVGTTREFSSSHAKGQNAPITGNRTGIVMSTGYGNR